MGASASKPRIAITGVGVVSSLGIGAETYYQGLRMGKSGAVVKDTWTEEGLDKAFFYPCPEINIKDYFQDLKAPFPQRYSQLAMMGCQTAVRSAGLENSEIPNDRIGLLLNTSLAANAAVENYLEKLFRDGPQKASPFEFTKTVSNTALGDVTRYYKFRGASSLLLGENSVTYGYDLLRNNEADIIICGGFDEIRDILMLSYEANDHLVGCHPDGELTAGQLLLKALEREDMEDKTVIGEAASFVVLEKLEHAKARGAGIIAEVVNYHTESDHSYQRFIFERNEETFASVMKESLEHARLQPADIDCVVGASCLPWQYNNYEGKAIEELWGEGEVYFTTVKPMIGETFGASGQSSLVAAAMMMKNREVLGHGLPEKHFHQGKTRVNAPEKTVESVDLRHVMVNSIHSGGNTTSIILRNPNL